jgi:predicted Zn-dependent protease
MGPKQGENKVLYKLATAILRRREMVQEIEDWEKLVDVHPDSRGFQMQLGVAYNKKQCTGRTVEGWKRLEDKYPRQRELSVHLKQAYDKKEDKKKNNRC